MIEVKIAKLVDHLEELAPKLASHWSEVEQDKDQVTLDPDFVSYLKLEEAGYLMLVICTSNECIVGYMWDLIHTNLHYNKLYAVNDVVYVDPRYRGYGIMHKMNQVAEDNLIKRGVVARTINLKSKQSDTVDGYTSIETVYHKNLGV